ncbi:MAG: hypothetical protein K0Q43_1350 [Ramlibacter sp.]|jgi:hypothetical protein|nr:hypothetical protein [Ramlibacter sp.]
MKLSTKSLATVAVVLGAFAAASAAHARSDVIFSIGVQSPGYGYVQPGYGYAQPAPIYVEPAPVYVAPPAYYAPRPVYVQPQVSYYGRSHHDRRYDGRYERRWGPNGDLDRDGIRNRNDRDIDGDGIRNRRDHFPADRYRY